MVDRLSPLETKYVAKGLAALGPFFGVVATLFHLSAFSVDLEEVFATRGKAFVLLVLLAGATLTSTVSRRFGLAIGVVALLVGVNNKYFVYGVDITMLRWTTAALALFCLSLVVSVKLDRGE